MAVHWAYENLPVHRGHRRRGHLSDHTVDSPRRHRNRRRRRGARTRRAHHSDAAAGRPRHAHGLYGFHALRVEDPVHRSAVRAIEAGVGDSCRRGHDQPARHGRRPVGS